MAINKNAVLRFNVLDKCFSNHGRKYYFDDLLNEVNKALIEDNPKSTGIQIRQLRDDIRFMKSEAGYSAPIETIREGKKAFYRYAEKNFSINNSPINKTEAEQLKNALAVLQRFEGSPEFEWVNELSPLIKDQFGLNDSSRKVMAFESNIDYTGYNNIPQIFNAIVNERVIKLKYQPFTKEIKEYNFHPYFLKQYNNRWFLLGKSDFTFDNYLTLALDRIESIEEIDMKYIPSLEDWEDYFYDMIGVSKASDDKAEQIILQFTPEQAPYIITKPIHPSQKTEHLNNGSLKVRIGAIINYELEMTLLAFGEKVEVIAPPLLKDRIKNRVKKAYNNYCAE